MTAIGPVVFTYRHRSAGTAILADLFKRLSGNGGCHVVIRLQDGTAVRGELTAVYTASMTVDVRDVAEDTPGQWRTGRIIPVIDIASIRQMPSSSCHICGGYA